MSGEVVTAEFLDPKVEKWLDQPLSIVVCGASGDLAKKKTYPALFDLYKDYALGSKTFIMGYARSKMTNVDFRDKLKPWLLKHGDEDQVDKFLDLCFYRSGQYDDPKDMKKVDRDLVKMHDDKGNTENRVFYFALPPSTFLDMAKTVREGGLGKKGFNRLIVEKPFGHDTKSAAKLGRDLGELFSEDYLYRIDHYLGKEMVQNIITLRFANTFFEPLWNRDHISSVVISFKEDIGTMGRGGYFDNYGIIRDVMQNHLMQVLSIIAMEPPVKVSGKGYSNYVRDEKVKVLKSIEPWRSKDCVIGQYTAGNGEPGYLDDETVPEGSNQPTYACVAMKIKNKRWDGVPFVMKAGKALNEKRVEVRIQFKNPPGAANMFGEGEDMPRNELVIRLQPEEAIYMKTNVKQPGLTTDVKQSELDLSYTQRYSNSKIYDAYTRLVLDVLRGKQATFVRDDELLAAWEIVDPLLRDIEEKGALKPIPYKFGTRGPKEADDLVRKHGYKVNRKYKKEWKEAQRHSLSRKKS